MKILLCLFFGITLAFSSSLSDPNEVWGAARILNIGSYGQVESLKLGEIFVLLQGQYFAKIFLITIIAVPSLFALHYMVIGPMRFSHDGVQIKTFSLFNRIVHWIAAVAFLMLVPSGLIMIFGSTFGGGDFVRFCRYVHDIGTVMFTIVVFPMFFMWAARMFVTFDDIKWLLIFGGYLSKKKDPVPAGKFNSGQKTWFWLATLGGVVMIVTGAMMYFLDLNTSDIQSLVGLSHIDLLRISAIVHNIFGVAMVVLFFVHIYMSMFAIKGSIYSMINGYKSEEEVQIMHSSWYKELKEKGKI